MAVDDILLEAEMHMEKASEHLHHELRAIRTGRATPGAGGAYQGGLLRVPDGPARDRVDQRAGGDAIAHQAVQPAGPQGDRKGDQRQQDRPDAAQRRQAVAADAAATRRPGAAGCNWPGQCKGFAEHAKIMIRNSRRDGNKAIETEEKDGGLTEDESPKRGNQGNKVQELTKQYEGKIDELIEHKKAEIMQV